jgi:hypothetical protein
MVMNFRLFIPFGSYFVGAMLDWFGHFAGAILDWIFLWMVVSVRAPCCLDATFPSVNFGQSASSALFSEGLPLFPAHNTLFAVVLPLAVSPSHYYVITYAHTYSHLDMTQPSQAQATHILVLCVSQRFSSTCFLRSESPIDPCICAKHTSFRLR